jgi:superfamily I DNA/RNA helicase
MFGMNVVDFGTLLVQCHRVLEIPKVRAGWQAKIRHVLLDEAQDCDTMQYRLHRCFAPPATFFSVGDTRQCIYTWRGARPDLMVTKEHTRTTPLAIHSLTTCFRSGTEIVRCANNLIANNVDPLVHPMVSAHDWPGEVSLQIGRSQDVAELVKRSHGGGCAVDRTVPFFGWSDIAVLSRRHLPLKSLGRCLDEMEIPFQHVGRGFEVCQTEEFRQMHACLRLAINDRDEMAFRRVLAIYDPNCHPVYTRIRARASELGIPSVQFLLSERDTYTADVRALIAAVTKAAQTQTIGELMPGLRARLPDHGVASQNAEWFWMNHCFELTVADALMWYGLSDAQDDIRDGDHVTLSTIHAAKGLEWPLVIVLDLNEGNLPSSQSVKDARLVPDERRVCYVAMTRAKERLIFHYRTRNEQKDRVQPPSRFLDEIRCDEGALTPEV